MIYSLIVLTAGFFVLVKGADWFVDGASSLASIFHVSQLVIGLTICAMGTSLPEAAVSLVAGLKGNSGITIGNVVGSNILNILIVLGMSQQVVSFQEGLILIGMFIIYLLYLFWLSQKESEEEVSSQYSFIGCVLLIGLGIFFVMIGSQLVVKAATQIAYWLHFSQRFIGLTIVAFGTSLPELVTSLQAARKDHAGIAIGNIVGSNIFNILFVIGTTSLICNVPFESKFLVDTIIAIIAGLILWFGTMKHQELRKPCGIVMLLCYMFYFIYLCLM